ncbi:MAG: 28S ribosomal protein S5, mitochondrial [Paramarteilia canceri]
MVSNNARKKGMAALTKRLIDLNRGRPLGESQEGYKWPGFTKTLLTKDYKLAQPVQEEKINENVGNLLDESSGRYGGRKRVRLNLPHAYRGFSGAKYPGIRVDNPPNTLSSNFDDFETRVLKLKYVGVPHGKLKRTLRLSCIVATGNKKGLIGVGYAKGTNKNAVIGAATNNAAKNLLRYKLCENRTVFHNYRAEYHKTRMLVYRKDPNCGLRCHRVINVLCRLIGILDLRVKIERNSKNTDSVIHAFLDGLRNMKNYQDIANETGLNVVMINDYNTSILEVLASPEEGFKRLEAKDPYSDYKYYNHFFPDKRIPHENPMFKRPEHDLKRYAKFIATKNKKKIRKDLFIHRIAANI